MDASPSLRAAGDGYPGCPHTYSLQSSVVFTHNHMVLPHASSKGWVLRRGEQWLPLQAPVLSPKPAAWRNQRYVCAFLPLSSSSHLTSAALHCCISSRNTDHTDRSHCCFFGFFHSLRILYGMKN